MGERILKSGSGWRLGWHPEAEQYCGLVGGDDWAFELTGEEWLDFCRLLGQLVETMSQMAGELMEEERIACEVESDRLWMEVEGFPHAYELRLILNSGRRCEGNWGVDATRELIAAAQTLTVF
ncbi:MAG: DUF1818 family protein [Cyanobacteria bacterium SBLK]|nr:DUF1818 family protein [Cyanobacteria bacterium SBLK]